MSTESFCFGPRIELIPVGMPAGAERRREHRYPTLGEAEVRRVDPSSSGAIPGRMVNVSKSGLCVRIPRALEAGARVRICFGETLAFAEVRWCRPGGEGEFDLGLRIEHTVATHILSVLRGSGGQA